MKIEELENCPQWLKNANTTNADVVWDSTKSYIEWRGGEWRGGVWRGGVWRGGAWMRGEWRGGVWRGGVWRGGEWRGGVWRGGEWQGGEWRGGVWWGGVWRGGVWHGGEWWGGVWRGGVWHGGEWRGGVWQGGVWRGGVWQGGEWQGKEDRMRYMLSILGIVGEDCVAYRTTQSDGYGRHNKAFAQPEGEYYEEDLPPAGTGTCVKGIHVTTAARAWTEFGVDENCQFWRVKFKRADILDCDGEKIRIRGGVFEKIERPF